MNSSNVVILLTRFAVCVYALGLLGPWSHTEMAYIFTVHIFLQSKIARGHCYGILKETTHVLKILSDVFIKFSFKFIVESCTGYR